MIALKDAPEITILDGPTFSNSIVSILKSILMLYNTTKGIKMQNIHGINAHELIVEQSVLKEHGKITIDLCKKYVCTSTFKLLGGICDDNQYCTMDKNYMESVWWAFSELYHKGLI
jgi:isoleucyl-tRNA synthetase